MIGRDHDCGYLREDKIIYAKFTLPHQVLSTCRLAGGLRDDIEYFYNHQSREPVRHMHAGTGDGFEALTPGRTIPGPGAINTMIFINKPLIAGAMVRVVMTATEAKTAALLELACRSMALGFEVKWDK